MRVVLAGWALLLSACTPFEGSRSVEEYAVDTTLEEAFPGARVMGSGDVEVHTGDDSSVTVPYVIQEGMVVAGGDMILGDAETLLERSAGLRLASQRWDTCTIPYSIDSNLPASSRSDFLAAVDHWETLTALRFEENPSARDRIRVVNGGGCSSYVGQVGGAQRLTLSSACGRGAAIHEIGHAMGYFHEQARSDRDEHVTIHWGNIRSGMEHNFRSWPQRGQAGVDIGSYDVGSIMHYGSWGFSTGTCWSGDTSGCTITHPDGRYLSENQRNGLSSGDLAGVRELYGHCGEPDPDDHGNTLDDATIVNAPFLANGTLDSGDVDMFAIHAPVGHFVTVWTSGATDTVGELYRDGIKVAEDDTAGAGPNFELSFVATDSAHHIAVKGWRPSSTGDYALHVTAEAPDQGDDHGDDLSQATVLTGSTSIAGNLTAGDEDYFRLDVPEGSTVTIGTSGSTDTVGDHIVNGVQVATDDTTGDGPNFELSFVTGPGVQHVRVEAWRTWLVGDYTLNVDIVLPTSGGDDHGDTVGTATNILFPQVGEIGLPATLDAGDSDVFRIEVQQAGALSAFTNGTTDTYGTLNDANGNLITQNDDTDAQNFAVTADVLPGLYFLHVRGYNAQSAGDYELTMTLE